MSSSMSVLVVTYCDYDNVVRLIENQPLCQGVVWYVIDNSPSAAGRSTALDRLAGRRDVVIVHPEPENPGYLGGAQYALEAHPEILNTDFVVVCNADTRFAVTQMQEQLFELTLRIPDFYERVGCVAPALMSAKGGLVRQAHYAVAPSSASFEKLLRIYRHRPMTIGHRLLADTKRHLRAFRGENSLPRKIFAPHGALMIFTRGYLDRTNCFKHPAFLFCEEVFVGTQCFKAGLDCIYEPKLQYSHENHGSMKIIPSPVVTRALYDGHRVGAQLLRDIEPAR